MISFKAFLQEKAMNTGTFAATLKRLSDDAKLGFELEVWVGEESLLYSDTEVATKDVSDLTTLTQWKTWFDIDQDTARAIRDEFNDWHHKKNGRGEWVDYFDDVFKDDPIKFINHYDINPLFDWADYPRSVHTVPFSPSGKVGAWRQIATDFAQELSDVVGTKVNVGYSGKTTDWVVVEDASIDGDGPGAGVEIVSPPLPVEDSMDVLKEIFRFMKRFKITTNESTGIHINLSIPDLESKLDPLKLILFMGEDHVLDSFERRANQYAKTHSEDIMASIQADGLPPRGSDYVKLARAMLKSDKYRTVDLSKLKQGYLEFRAAGNANYEQDWKKISDTIGRFLTVLELACDPDAERKEYLKKAAKIFASGTKNFKNKVRGDTLKDIIISTSGLMMWQQIEELLKEERISRTMAGSLLAVLMIDIGEMVLKMGYAPTEKVSAEFKQLVGKFSKKVDGLFGAATQGADDRGQTEEFDAFVKAFRIRPK